MTTSLMLAAAMLGDIPKDPPNPYYIRFLGDPILTTPAVRVEAFDAIPVLLVRTMFDVCRQRRGYGLSAQQVGGLERIAVSTVNGKLTVMINPEITKRSQATERSSEGCLFIPGFYTTIERHLAVTAVYEDENSARQAVVLEGMEARCIQHEIDHLNGKLIVDGLPRQQRRLAERLAAKGVR